MRKVSLSVRISRLRPRADYLLHLEAAVGNAADPTKLSASEYEARVDDLIYALAEEIINSRVSLLETRIRM
jgi:hypothetical protein